MSVCTEPEAGTESAPAAEPAPKRATWYVDSSVLLRALLGDSAAAKSWFEQAKAHGDRFIGSRMVEVEVRRVVRNIGQPQDAADAYLDEFALDSIDNDLLDESIAIPHPLGAADSIHVATAMRLGTGTLTLVTHDAQMARAAQALGFTVHDPVTDDPNRAPVA